MTTPSYDDLAGILRDLAADSDYLDWEHGWIDSCLHLTDEQIAMWRSLLPAPETDRG